MANPDSINTQLFNSVAKLAQAQDHLSYKKELLERAKFNYNEAVEQVSKVQMEFEDLVNQVKKNPPKDTIWAKDKMPGAVPEGIFSPDRLGDTKLRGPENQRLVNPPIPQNPRPIGPENRTE